eukprot:3041771-Karenia_brevis.AAC.1
MWNNSWAKNNWKSGGKGCKKGYSYPSSNGAQPTWMSSALANFTAERDALLEARKEEEMAQTIKHTARNAIIQAFGGEPMDSPGAAGS